MTLVHSHEKIEVRREENCLTYQAKVLLRTTTESNRVPALWDMIML